MWQLGPDEGRALYQRIIRHIETAVAAGHLTPGERLPPERDLARLLGVNRSTIIHALDAMADRGVLIRKRGSGTYVNKEKWGVQSYARLNWPEPPALLPVIRDSPFHRRVAVLRRQSKRDGSLLLDLSRDDFAPDLLPHITLPPGSWEELVRAEQGEESSTLGLAALRHSVVRFLHQRVGLSVPFEDVCITSGSRQAIFLITQCLLKMGDAVGVEAPSYFYSLPVFQVAGLRLYALPMDEQGITVEGLDNLVSRRSLKMIFLNPVFHNPTGTVMTEDRKKAVLDFCATAHIPVVEDDAYSLLDFGKTGENPAHRTMKAMDRQNQVIYTGSLSSYAGRNIRAGWLVAPPGVIAKLALARHMMDAGLSVLPQLLAGEYLDHVAAQHLPRLRAELAVRASSLAIFLRNTFDGRLVFALPPGGLYIYATVHPAHTKQYLAMQQTFLDHGIIPALGEEFGDIQPSFRLNFSLFRPHADC